MKTVEQIKNAMKDENIMSKFEKYADKLGVTVDQAIRGLASDWHDEEDGLYRSILEGDLENMLDEEV